MSIYSPGSKLDTFMLTQIALYIQEKPKDLVNFASTCKKFRTISDSDIFWKGVAKTHKIEWDRKSAQSIKEQIKKSVEDINVLFKELFPETVASTHIGLTGFSSQLPYQVIDKIALDVECTFTAKRSSQNVLPTVSKFVEKAIAMNQPELLYSFCRYLKQNLMKSKAAYEKDILLSGGLGELKTMINRCCLTVRICLDQLAIHEVPADIFNHILEELVECIATYKALLNKIRKENKEAVLNIGGAAFSILKDLSPALSFSEFRERAKKIIMEHSTKDPHILGHAVYYKFWTKLAEKSQK